MRQEAAGEVVREGVGCGVWGDVGEDVDGSCSVGVVTGEAKVKAKVNV